MPTKSKSGNPDKKITSAKEWKKAKAEIELTLPSGNVCLAKRPGLPQLLSDGALPDMLTPIAQKSIDAGQSGKEVTPSQAQEMISELMAKEGGIDAMLDSFARITARCVVDPAVVYHKRKVDTEVNSLGGVWETIPDADRDDDLLYTDDVDMEDQMFIFQYVVGGSKDLAEFRKQLGQPVVGLVDVESSKEDAS